MAAILILLVVYTGGSGAVAMKAVEYGSTAACEEAGRAAKSRFDGWPQRVQWSCSPKGDSGPSAPQAR